MSFSDVILRSALEVGFYELRTRPDWIDYAFRGMVADELTTAHYGQTEREAAKRWFLSTNIPVVSAQRLDAAVMPCVSILMLSDAESNNKLDDRHHDTKEYGGGWPDLCAPFVPTSFDPATGILGLPPALVAQLLVVPGQYLVDRFGRVARIAEKLDATTLRIRPGTPLEVAGLVVRGQYPPTAVTLRSAYFEEGFSVGCHDRGDHAKVIWLYTLTKFTLLRVRRRLLEARGFEVSSISGSDLRRADSYDTDSQPGFARYLTVRGKVLNVWPDDEAVVAESVAVTFTFSTKDSPIETECE